jgi:hypothetical protein
VLKYSWLDGAVNLREFLLISVGPGDEPFDVARFPKLESLVMNVCTQKTADTIRHGKNLKILILAGPFQAIPGLEGLTNLIKLDIWAMNDGKRCDLSWLVAAGPKLNLEFVALPEWARNMFDPAKVFGPDTEVQYH